MQTKLYTLRVVVSLSLGLFWAWFADMIGLAWPLVILVGLVVAGLLFSLLNLVEMGREPERWEDLR